MKGFAKVYDELIELGVPAKVAALYGKHEYYIRIGMRRTEAELAKELHVSERQLRNLSYQARQFGLLEWTQGKQHEPNTYRVLDPDRKFISGLIAARQSGNKLPPSDLPGRKFISPVLLERTGSEKNKSVSQLVVPRKTKGWLTSSRKRGITCRGDRGHHCSGGSPPSWAKTFR